MDLKELESGVNPDQHWYYQTKKVCLLDFFKRTIVKHRQKVTLIDIGAGSGFFSLEIYKTYGDYVDSILLVDLYYSEQEVADSRGLLVQKLTTIPDDVSNAFIIMMDVIEHVEDDYTFFSSLLSKVSSRSFFYITVPAFQSLWSGHDVFLGHYRRYTLPQLRLLLRQDKIHTLNTFYQYALIFPLVWVLRKLPRKSAKPKNDMKPTSPIINLVLEMLLSLEMRLAKYNNWFGLTCTAEGYIE
ncbi:MAG: hypothetical protein ACFCVD_06875 [Nodosilinea sp.]